MSLGQNQRLVCAAFLLHKDAEDLIVPEASSPCLHRQSAEGWKARMWSCSVWDYPSSNLSQQRWISWPGGAHSHRAASVSLSSLPAPGYSAINLRQERALLCVFVACGTTIDAFLQCGCPNCASHSGKRCRSCLSLHLQAAQSELLAQHSAH